MISVFCKDQTVETFQLLGSDIQRYMYKKAILYRLKNPHREVINKVINYYEGAVVISEIIDRTVLAPSYLNSEVSSSEKAMLKHKYLKRIAGDAHVIIFDDNKDLLTYESPSFDVHITSNGMNPEQLRNLRKGSIIALDFDGTITTEKITLPAYNNTVPWLIKKHFGGEERFIKLLGYLKKNQVAGSYIMIITMNFKNRIKPLLDRLLHYTAQYISIEIYDRIQKYILTAVYGKNQPKFITKLPGPQPVGLSVLNIDAVKYNDYYVCEKTDGERAILLICGNFVCYFDRKFDMTVIERGDDEIRGSVTILDCERLGKTFIPFDAIEIKGSNISQLTYPERLKKLDEFLTNTYLWIVKKTIVPVKNIRTITDKITRKDGKYLYDDREIDGLIFTPGKQPYMPKIPIYKFKFPELHTIDFYVEVSNTGISFQVSGDKSQLVPFAKTEFVEPGEKARRVYEKFNGKIVECAGSEGGVEWIPIRIRRDKSTPNYVGVAEDTVKLLRENMGLEKLLSKLK
jgi:hypothetical protein